MAIGYEHIKCHSTFSQVVHTILETQIFHRLTAPCLISLFMVETNTEINKGKNNYTDTRLILLLELKRSE